ncbi:FG-GAP repeat domain-containing protein [Saccharibacillus alkalitolerans]|uniref:VCBS repeat-containing protein n=1 Tax=Saccharibacillus alkalitolerans TaxID=2705290 RepID=A0ABX0F2A3_9BACL|nr:VCBS repeat-containing protein [Saccharibacillus alkalitolerans]NGZ74518.1 VCBS repeat-containing protein [Saccharibacillus alkalitolerans]
MRKLWLSLVGAACLLLLSGCSDTLSLPDPTSLIRPPRLPADKEMLKSAIVRQLPTGATQVRARDAKDTTTVHYADLDGDGRRETAVVFYKPADSDGNLHMMILQEQGENWVKVLDIAGEGPVLDKLEFADITGDGFVDILAGYGVNGEDPASVSSNILMVYSYIDNHTLEALQSKLPYANFELVDMDGDNRKELAMINMKPDIGTDIRLYEYKDKAFQELSSLVLPNKTVTGYYNVTSGKVFENQNGLVLDILMGTSVYTQIVVMKNGVLEPVLSEDSTFKDGMVKSEDVNGDGIIEVGTLTTVPEGWSYFENKEDIPSLTMYRQWDGAKGLTPVREQYRDPNGRFVLQPFPKELLGNVTLSTVSMVDKYLKFVRIDNREWIEEVRFFTPAQWQNEASGKDWIKLYSTSSQVIAYRVNPDGEMREKKTGIPSS